MEKKEALPSITPLGRVKTTVRGLVLLLPSQITSTTIVVNPTPMTPILNTPEFRKTQMEGAKVTLRRTKILS